MHTVFVFFAHSLSFTCVWKNNGQTNYFTWRTLIIVFLTHTILHHTQSSFCTKSSSSAIGFWRKKNTCLTISFLPFGVLADVNIEHLLNSQLTLTKKVPLKWIIHLVLLPAIIIASSAERLSSSSLKNKLTSPTIESGNNYSKLYCFIMTSHLFYQVWTSSHIEIVYIIMVLPTSHLFSPYFSASRTMKVHSVKRKCSITKINLVYQMQIIGGSKGYTPGPISFIFMQLSWKLWPNNMLATGSPPPRLENPETYRQQD